MADSLWTCSCRVRSRQSGTASSRITWHVPVALLTTTARVLCQLRACGGDQKRDPLPFPSRVPAASFRMTRATHEAFWRAPESYRNYLLAFSTALPVPPAHDPGAVTHGHPRHLLTATAPATHCPGFCLTHVRSLVADALRRPLLSLGRRAPDAEIAAPLFRFPELSTATLAARATVSVDFRAIFRNSVRFSRRSRFAV